MDGPQGLSQSFVIEHMDPELGPWSALEYAAIATESAETGDKVYLSGIPSSLEIPSELRSLKALKVQYQSVAEIYGKGNPRVCLLDPGAATELSPGDAEKFDVFLFGGILGDDPPRDRTSELRKNDFAGRTLGSIQMTTDTAVRVTRKVIKDKVQLKDILYVDHPELKIDEHESTRMPFRYVKNPDGSPLMPKGMLDLINKDSNKDVKDLL